MSDARYVVRTLDQSLAALKETAHGQKAGRHDYVTWLSAADCLNIYKEMERLRNFEKTMTRIIKDTSRGVTE